MSRLDEIKARAKRDECKHITCERCIAECWVGDVYWLIARVERLEKALEPLRTFMTVGTGHLPTIWKDIAAAALAELEGEE